MVITDITERQGEKRYICTIDLVNQKTHIAQFHDNFQLNAF